MQQRSDFSVYTCDFNTPIRSVEEENKDLRRSNA